MRGLSALALAIALAAAGAGEAQMAVAAPAGWAKPLPVATQWHFAAGETMEADTDRPGSDFENFDLPEPDPALCQRRCAQSEACQAWTYVKPGWQGPHARCWLKNAAPPARSHECCISGLKTAAQMPSPEATELGPEQLAIAIVEGTAASSDAVRSRWGLPDAFTKMAIAADDGRPVVVEVWEYFSRQVAHVVIDGIPQDLVRIPMPPATWKPRPAIDPGLFRLGITPGEVGKSLNAALDIEEAEKDSFSVVVLHGTTLGFENGRLVYVDTGPEAEQAEGQ